MRRWTGVALASVLLAGCAQLLGASYDAPYIDNRRPGSTDSMIGSVSNVFFEFSML